MDKTVTMPKLGMTMEEGELLNWRYKEGEWVEKGEPLVEIMTDKVNIEFEAPFDGKLVRILAKEGDVLPVGSPIATIDNGKEESPSSSTTRTSEAREQRNEPIASVAPVQEAQTSSVSSLQSIPSTPAAKRIAELQGIDLHAVYQSVAHPLHLADLTAFMDSKKASTTQKQETPVQPQETAKATQPTVRATPVAQRVAREHQVDLAEVAGNTNGRKVTRADIEAHLVEKTREAEQQQAPASLTPNVATLAPKQIADESDVLPVSSIRRLIGQRMVQSITTAPHIYLDTEIDMTEAERCRQRVGKSLKEKGLPAPSVTAILVQAVTKALLLHPEVNATLETSEGSRKESIRQWRNVHIGIAVDTERALLTPVIRNAHTQSLQQLSLSLRQITQAARDGSIRPDDLSGATFTISNLGMYGIDTFHAIIAPGQSAILAVGKVTKRAIVIEENGSDRVEIRPMMRVSLSADHRVLDGASGSRFLQQFKRFLEDPYLLL